MMERVRRAIVADDDEAVRTVIAAWIDQLGYQVTVAEGGVELIALCRATTPDLVVSDVRMCDLGGLAAAAVLRDEMDVPVVLMSGSWDEEETCRAAALGAARLDKPFRPLALVAAIAHAAGCPAPQPRAVVTSTAS